jgi:hypothetical protein
MPFVTQSGWRCCWWWCFGGGGGSGSIAVVNVVMLGYCALSFQKSLYSRGLGKHVGERTSCAHSRAMRAHDRVDAHMILARSSHHPLRCAVRRGRRQVSRRHAIVSLALSRRRSVVSCVVRCPCSLPHTSRVADARAPPLDHATAHAQGIATSQRCSVDEVGARSLVVPQYANTGYVRAHRNKHPWPSHSQNQCSAFTLRRMGARHLPAHVHHFELKERSVVAMAYKA